MVGQWPAFPLPPRERTRDFLFALEDRRSPPHGLETNADTARSRVDPTGSLRRTAPQDAPLREMLSAKGPGQPASCSRAHRTPARLGRCGQQQARQTCAGDLSGSRQADPPCRYRRHSARLDPVCRIQSYPIGPAPDNRNSACLGSREICTQTTIFTQHYLKYCRAKTIPGAGSTAWREFNRG